MATRTISTRLTIEGEDQYRQSIKNCNSELSVLKSELAKVQSQYEGEANSLNALNAKQAVLNSMLAQQQEKVKAAKSALEAAKSAQKTYGDQVEACKSKISAAEAEMEQLKNSTGNTAKEQKALAKEIADLGKELTSAEAKEQAAAKRVADYQKQTNYAERDLNKLNTQIAKNNQYLEEAKNSTTQTATSIDRYGKEIRKATHESEEFGEKTEEAFGTMAAALAASGVVTAVKEIERALASCVSSAMEFESGMAEVFTLLPGESKKARAQLTDDMMKFSTEMNVLTSEGVPALYQAISAGVPKENVFEFMTTAQKAAVGGVTDLKTSVDGLTSIVNAYGEANINAQQTADMLFTAVKLGKTDFQQLSGHIYNVVPTAAAAKIGFEDVAAALAVITARGVPTSVATTQLRQMFVELTDSGSDVAKTFEQITGQSFKKFIAGGGNVQQALQKLEQHAVKSGLGVNELFGSVEAGNAALSLTGQATESFTKALEEMGNSAGAADAAYETMIQTAEYAAQRVQVAFTNVQTAIGDALLPAFRDLAEGAAIGLDWAGDFIEQNPWLVQAITAVTVGIAGFTVAVTAAQAVQLLFNFAMNANPAVKVASAIGAVTAALVIFVAGANDGTESVKDLTTAATAASNAMEDINKKYDDSTRKTAASAEVASRYVDRLKELEDQGLKTDAAHKEYADIVDRLDMLIPDLNLKIDEQTGLLEGNTAELLANIEALKERALDEARQERTNELLQQQAEATVELQENQEALKESEAEIARLREESIAISEGQIEIETSKREAMQEIAEQIARESEHQKALNEAIEEGQQVISDYDSELENSLSAQEEFAAGTEDIEEALTPLNSALANAQATYSKLAQEARESIDKQIGAWEEMDNTAKTSADTLNKALQSQITYLGNYSANLESLAGRNIEGVDNLVASLSDGSKESAAILAGLTTATDQEITQIIANMGKVEEGKRTFSDTVASLDTEFKVAMDAVVAESNRYTEMTTSGEHSVQGAIDGAERKRSDLIKKYRSLANSANGAFRAALRIESPSKVFKESGEMTIEGAIQGIESKEDDLKETMKAAVDLAIEGFDGKNEEAAERAREFLDIYNQAISDAADNTKEVAKRLQSNLDEITEQMEEVEKKQEDMANKLSEYGDLFTIDSKTDKMTLEDLDEQIEALNRYEETLNSLKEAGISEGLLDEVLAMDIDDAINYGDQLMDMYEVSPEKWEEYNQKWEEKQRRAKEIADAFYSDQLDSLTVEYDQELRIGLDALKATSFDSGVDTIQGLMDGMRSKEDALYAQAQGIADNISRIINSALSSGGSSSGRKKSGSHAGGLDYVPFDGYLAELHKGERVLTASEANAYIAAAQPSSFDIPAPDRTAERRETEAVVNAISTLVGGIDQRGQDGPATIVLQMGDGTEMARWLLPSIREASNQSPRIERDDFV